jgi:peptide/nickel transport system ATP-binding protein
MATIEISSLTKSYHSGGILTPGKKVAVDDVSLSLSGEKPWVLSIVGESGSGKTTLARMILRLLEPTSGSLVVDGLKITRELNQSAESTAFKRRVQPVFQNPFETFSTRRKVVNYLLDTAVNLKVSKSRSEARKAVAASLSAVGLSWDYVDGKYVRHFSGGELQRISIARALVAKPSLIVADEPVASIDASLKMNIVNLFLSLKEKSNTSFVYITHDLSTAYYLSDYIAIMYAGKIVEYGKTSEIMLTPAHPYTLLLMDSVAEVNRTWNSEDDTEVIEDSLPSASIGTAAGCPFHHRCSAAREICSAAKPPKVQLSSSRYSICFQHVNYQINH